MTQNEQADGQGKKPRKRPVKSEYLFPLYDLGAALMLIEKVETSGGGTLTEESLAIALGVSTKSSSFKLKGLTARQFGLVTKHGETLTTTGLAKSIFKPTNDQEKEQALSQAFNNIPLFKAMMERFKGAPIPDSNVLRNILEREFKVQHSRVTDAERVLMDSAREAGALHTSGSKTYLHVKAGAEAGAVPIVLEDHTPLTPPGDTPPPPDDPPPARDLTIEQMRMEYVRKLVSLLDEEEDKEKLMGRIERLLNVEDSKQ